MVTGTGTTRDFKTRYYIFIKMKDISFDQHLVGSLLDDSGTTPVPSTPPSTLNASAVRNDDFSDMKNIAALTTSSTCAILFNGTDCSRAVRMLSADFPVVATSMSSTCCPIASM